MLLNPKRKGILAAVFLAVAVLTVFWLRHGAARDEPRYQGQPLSFWVQQRVPSNSNLYFAVTLSDEGASAVRQIGTNALPTLVRWMIYPEDTLRGRLLLRLKDTRASAIAVRFLVPKSYQPGSAVLAFQALGPDAKGAIPALVQMLHEPDNFRWAVMALCAIGTEGATAIQKAFPTIGDGILRANIVLQLEHGISPELQGDFAPVLAQQLKDDSSAAARMSAARVLGKLTNAAAVAVPALIGAMQGRDGGARMVAAESLGYFGPGALSAVPSLEAALNDQDPQVRINAANALRLIQGAVGDERDR